MREVPDKSWLSIEDRFNDSRYEEGVNAFLDYAETNPNNTDNGRMTCPCKKCGCRYLNTREEIHEDVMLFGWMNNYTTWTRHGEIPRGIDDVDPELVEEEVSCDMDTRDDMQEMLHDIYIDPCVGEDSNGNVNVEPNYWDLDGFLKLMKDAEHDLYTGCKQFTKLSFLLRLFQIKNIGGWSNKSFGMLLELLRKALPSGEKSIPKNYYEAKKIITELGLDYVKIDACRNDCMLYYKNNVNKETCIICNASRWKQEKSNSKGEESLKKTDRNKVAAKQL